MRCLAPLKISCIAAALIGLFQCGSQAQNLPLDVGTTVNGFQDNFAAPTRDPAWTYHGGGPDAFYQAFGVMQIGSTNMLGDPNHLLYQPATTYSSTTQEVLVRIRIRVGPGPTETEGTLANFRAGVTVANNPDIQNGEGINLLIEPNDFYSDGDTTPNVGLLYDYIAWGPPVASPDLPWTTNTWYWMRLSIAGTNDANNINAKFWLGDGTEVEPADWQVSWTQPGPAGFAGIQAGSAGEPCQFDVDYFLVKSPGLPSITVAPDLTDSTISLHLTGPPQNATNGVGQSATFTVVADGNHPLSYQWQVATAANPTSFANVSTGTGGNSATYSTAPLTLADSGSQYRVIVSIGSASLTSAAASLTIDTTPPTMLSAKTLGNATHVTLTFSEGMALPANTSGLSIDNGVVISGVSYASTPSGLLLSLSAPLSLGTTYTVTVNGLTDLSGNSLASTQMVVSFAMEVPFEFGTTVNGFQDDFDAATRSSDWVPVPAGSDVYTQTNGVLHVQSGQEAPVDPNHLLYEPATTYGADQEEVLIRIKPIQWSWPDPSVNSRGGLIAFSDPFSAHAPGAGIDYTLLDTTGFGTPDHTQTRVLVDYVGWSDPLKTPDASASLTWQTNVWYWMRLNITGLTTSSGANILGKMWPADGLTPEPDNWQVQYGYNIAIAPGDNTFAGILAASQAELTVFDVDYFLVEAPELPSITVAPKVFTFGSYVNITSQPASEFVLLGQPANFSVTASGPTPPTYQWQRAAAGSSAFANIPGATSSSYGINAIVFSDIGSKYQVIVTSGGISKTSLAAQINSDTTPPTVSWAKTLGFSNQVTVSFNEAITVPADASGFTLDHGATVASLAAAPAPNQVVLSVSTLSLSTAYTLTVKSVSDLYGNTLTSATVPVDFNVFYPADFGQTLAGFQDDFAASVRDTNWQVWANGSSAQPPADPTSDNYVQANGVLTIGATPGNPNHLVYVPTTPYNSTTQEVLVRLKIDNFGIGGNFLVGPGVCVQNNNSRGINWLLRNVATTADGGEFPGESANMLDDFVAWGPGVQYQWSPNVWYWMRLRQEPNLAQLTNSFDVYGKIWVADGSEAEPADWQLKWDAYGSSPGGSNLTPIRGAAPNIGVAGIDTGDNSVDQTAEVDYILIKADGLPSITANVSLFPFVPSPRAALTLTHTGSSITLTWPGAGTLQSSATVNGPWTNVGSGSPYNTTAVGAQNFYRLHY